LVPAYLVETRHPCDEAVRAEEPAPYDNQTLLGDATELPADVLPDHILLVEDSMIIALDTEENLKRLGVRSVQVESNVKGALKAIELRAPDFAIIDYNLGAESSAPVAAALRRRGIRFVLATGYSESAGQFEALGAAAVLRKPYGRCDIKQMLLAEECLSA